MFRRDTAFFPPVREPRVAGHLEVGDGHRIWWEETGRPDGVPVLVLHGGPGGAIKPYYRRLLDPLLCRGVFFDQRGCGNSTPRGDIGHNDTMLLVADIERLREARGIERWIVVGGSWGSTLALAYAESHPASVAAMVLSGIFLARAADRWWLWEGARWVFPDSLACRDAWLPGEERHDPREAFRRRLLDADPAASAAAARVLFEAESDLLDLMPPEEPPEPVADHAIASAGRVYMHYDSHDYFLAENQLLSNVHRLARIPADIIAGRADMCTPPLGAWELHQAWPGSALEIVPAAGHRWNDEWLGRAVVAAISRRARAFGNP